MPHTRKPGDLEGACEGGHPREGETPQADGQNFEESDAAVVPKKSTKTWVTPVEATEERAATERKSDARNALRTQGREGVLTALHRIGERAKEKPEEKLTNLLSHVKVPLLKEAYIGLQKEAAPGIDGIKWAEYGERLEERLLDLQDRIHRGSYHPQPVRRVHIPKGNGGTRPLGIPTLEDKIVQRAVRMILEPIYEAQFIGFSYGFRPGRSQHDALDALSEAIRRKVNWVLDADIQSFFDNIEHDWMKQFLEHRIGDPRMVHLLMKWMHAGVEENGELRETERGTPQGGRSAPCLRTFTCITRSIFGCSNGDNGRREVKFTSSAMPTTS